MSTQLRKLEKSLSEVNDHVNPESDIKSSVNKNFETIIEPEEDQTTFDITH